MGETIGFTPAEAYGELYSEYTSTFQGLGNVSLRASN
jgi:hypothetical protein